MVPACLGYFSRLMGNASASLRRVDERHDGAMGAGALWLAIVCRGTDGIRRFYAAQPHTLSAGDAGGCAEL
ncbi:MAG: hypothetical protein GPOALKHO_001496 [Sodalis sp.]|nr:MAG: hypothetical protein GPOALKHO_001496 [Sodalis sp.]